ncbi:cytochrome C oxidase subunit IV family protein [Mycobacterium sp.]|uniref:cytochrome C oxidase subunit IV family protein n=1 Tax=Mycobacterium sp. TaxID=1785 RepID=UPI001223C28E|nr:cytochrome C oxidase subunit IV family protein [Mycobacterium sp.]TAM65771.1 MAG: hypothetical protein EPN51_18675 [Mycobacterium sp.]
MINHVPRRALLLWVLMVVFTCLTWSIGGGHLLTPTTITATVLAIAFVKMRFIGLDFMELRTAPLPLAGCYDLYLVTVYIALMGMYVAL